eukprot:8412028-Alexandrium_andersonii.AAC.1
MSTRLGAYSARWRGGGAASWATRGLTRGSTPELAGSPHHTHGAAERSWRVSHDQRSPKRRRAAARTSRASQGLTATTRAAVPQRRPNHTPDSHRGLRLRPMSVGRTRSHTRSPNS